jgi:hypothetical protein
VSVIPCFVPKRLDGDYELHSLLIMTLIAYLGKLGGHLGQLALQGRKQRHTLKETLDDGNTCISRSWATTSYIEGDSR